MKPLQGTLTREPPRVDHRKVVLDSFAWIEYFSGSQRGEKVRELIETGAALSPTIVIAEISEKYLRTKQDPEPKIAFIEARSGIIPLDEHLAKAAGRINHERKKTVKGWGMADSIILATGRRHKTRIVTGDPHFEDLASETLMM